MTTVGQLRQSAALVEANRRVVLVTQNEAIADIIRNLRVVWCYPDTTDENGEWVPTFKIEVAGPKGEP